MVVDGCECDGNCLAFNRGFVQPRLEKIAKIEINFMRKRKTREKSNARTNREIPEPVPLNLQF